MKECNREGNGQKKVDSVRNHTRVKISAASERWWKLGELRGLKSDAIADKFLLDRYDKIVLFLIGCC